jgi:polyisoprenoid-binding protein YceI
MKTKLLLACIILLCSFATFTATQWQPADEEYTIRFSSRSAKGTIGGLKGSIHFDSTDLAHSGFDVTVDVATLNTGNKLKNKHALGEGFFDAAHYPTIGFTSDSIVKQNTYLVYGKLRIKDVTKSIVIPFQFSRTANKGIFTGRFSINRKDYHLRRFAVSKQVDVELNIPVDAMR